MLFLHVCNIFKSLQRTQMNCRLDATLRVFRPSDLEAVKQVIFSTVDLCYSGVYPPRAIEFFKQYHCDENILDRAKKGYTIICELEGKVLATGTILENHICAVFVVRAAQCQGLGQRIMEDLENKARTAGFTEVTLDVSLPSSKFYERLGYRLSEDTYLDVGEGQRLDYWTAKKLIIE
jgi:GNAT superfamily N-acetyltransferase